MRFALLAACVIVAGCVSSASPVAGTNASQSNPPSRAGDWIPTHAPIAAGEPPRGSPAAVIPRATACPIEGNLSYSYFAGPYVASNGFPLFHAFNATNSAGEARLRIDWTGTAQPSRLALHVQSHNETIANPESEGRAFDVSVPASDLKPVFTVWISAAGPVGVAYSVHYVGTVTLTTTSPPSIACTGVQGGQWPPA